jgi:hypothetical protein
MVTTDMMHIMILDTTKNGNKESSKEKMKYSKNGLSLLHITMTNGGNMCSLEQIQKENQFLKKAETIFTLSDTRKTLLRLPNNKKKLRPAPHMRYIVVTSLIW